MGRSVVSWRTVCALFALMLLTGVGVVPVHAQPIDLEDRCDEGPRLDRRVEIETDAATTWIDEYGCDFIHVINALHLNNDDVLSHIGETPHLVPRAITLFGTDRTLTQALTTDPIVPELLFAYLSALEAVPDDADRLMAALLTLQDDPAARLELLADRNALFPYFYAASVVSDPSDGTEIATWRNRFSDSGLPTDMYPAFASLLALAPVRYPNLTAAQSFQRVTRAIRILQQRRLTRILDVDTGVASLIYFLPPHDTEVPQVQRFSAQELAGLRDDYVRVMGAAFDEAVDQYNVALALELVGVLSGPLTDALAIHGNAEKIEAYLRDQIGAPALRRFLRGEDACSLDDVRERLAVSFTMFEPREERSRGEGAAPTFEIKIGRRGNLGRIAAWYAEAGRDARAVVNDQTSAFGSYLEALTNGPSAYFSIRDANARDVFQELTSTLGPYPAESLAFLTVIHEARTNSFDYFAWIGTPNSDARDFVDHRDVVSYGRDGPKYRYILETSFPEQYDPSIYQAFLSSEDREIDYAGLYWLYLQDAETLATHRFTPGAYRDDFIRFVIGAIEPVLNVIDVVAIVSIPLTSGGSASAIVATQFARQTVRSMARQLPRYVGRRMARRVFNETVQEATEAAIRNVAFAALRYQEFRGGDTALAELRRVITDVHTGMVITATLSNALQPNYTPTYARDVACDNLR